MESPETIEINVDDVIFDPAKYPRRKWDSITVTMLRNSLDIVPPILINCNHILIDGYHRLQAHKLEGIQIIKARIQDLPDENILWESTKLNSAHGKQLTLEEKQDLAKRFYKENNTTESEIATILSTSIGKVSEWVSSIRKERNEAREQKILDLYLRCWTEEKIAEEVGVSRQEVNKTIATFFTDENHSNPPDSLQVYNLWEFPSPDNPPDPEFPGLMPPQIVENLLWYYTEPFELILDPMAGSGTTLDVCLKMKRRCLCYDINPTRPHEIEQHDITKGFPVLPQLRQGGQIVKPKLILLDPPYWKQRQKDYTKDPTNLTNLPLEDFHIAISDIIERASEIIKHDGYIALIMSSTRKDRQTIDHIPLILNKLDFGNWSIIERVIVSYTTQQALAYHYTQAKEGRYMLRLYRDLVIMQKMVGGNARHP